MGEEFIDEDVPESSNAVKKPLKGVLLCCTGIRDKVGVLGTTRWQFQRRLTFLSFYHRRRFSSKLVTWELSIPTTLPIGSPTSLHKHQGVRSIK